MAKRRFLFKGQHGTQVFQGNDFSPPLQSEMKRNTSLIIIENENKNSSVI